MKVQGEYQFINDYVEQMKNIFTRMHPEWDEKKLEKKIKEKVYEKTSNFPVTLKNNYTKEEKESTLLDVFDWVKKRKPIISGNGTFYKRQSESINPPALMLRYLLSERKQIKREAFKIADPDNYKYKSLDREQGNKKRATNSYYGASGAPHSAFYSEYSIPATTGAAQSIISSTLWLFEPLIGNNYKFSDLNELFYWMEYVLENRSTKEMETWIVTANRDSLYERLIEKFYNYKAEYGLAINHYLDSLTDAEVTLLYYQSNLGEFISSHQKVINLFCELLEKVTPIPIGLQEDDPNFEDKLPNEYKGRFADGKECTKFFFTEGFLNPNSLPEKAEPIIKRLYSLFERYCFVPYLAFDRIWKLKNLPRKVATIIDTDSNILALDEIINLVMDLCKDTIDSLYDKDSEQIEIIIVNMITYLITNTVSQVLYHYTEKSNIDPDYRQYLAQKNEFYMDRMFVGLSKKRYFSRIKIREGVRLKKVKQDIKGFEIMKSVVSIDTSEKYAAMLKKYFLDPTTPMVKECINELLEFKRSIKASIKAGDLKYLPIGSAKNADAYSDASTQGPYRGVCLWNELYPDNAIEFPAKVSMLSLKGYRRESLEPLKTSNPDIYNKIISTIFEDKSGIFVKSHKTGNKVTEKCTGLSVLAIPLNEKIPEWCDPYIDYTSLINKIIAPFNPVLEIFGIPAISEGKTGDNSQLSERFSNIVKF